MVAHQTPALPLQAADEDIVRAAQGGVECDVRAQGVAARSCSAMASR